MVCRSIAYEAIGIMGGKLEFVEGMSFRIRTEIILFGNNSSPIVPQKQYTISTVVRFSSK